MTRSQYTTCKKSILKIVFVILASALISGAAYGSWKIFGKSESASVIEEPTTELNVLEPITSPEPNVTADWKAYRNEEYGYEIRYPKDWEILHKGYYKREIPYEVSFAPKGLRDLYAAPIAILIHSEDLKSASRASGHEEVQYEEEVIINGLISKSQIRTGPDGEFGVIFVPREEKLTYELRYNNLEFKNTFYQMLSTFKFIK